MTFVEAAIEVLREAGKPLSAEELTALVVERNLLSKPGKSPLSSMKGRLTAELNKGADSRVKLTEPDVWTLADADAAVAKAGTKSKAKPKKAAAKTAKAKAAAKPTPPRAPAKKAGAKKAAAKKAATGEAAPAKAAGVEATTKPSAIPTTPTEEPQAEPEPKAELTPEEKEFAEVYGEAPADTVGVAALTEYRDDKTADEDREMVPEMVAERRGRRDRDRDRDRDRRGRRERKRRRDRSGDAERREGEPQRREGEPQRATSDKLVPADTHTALVEVPSERALVAVAPSPLALVDKAASVLRSMPDSRGVPLAQLAQMMRKRRLLSQPVELAIPVLRSALRFDERWSHRRGLRPTVAHMGRDRYGLDGNDLADQRVRAAEERFRAALMELEAATKARLTAVLAKLELDALERVVQLYLEQSGYSDLEWIKRAGKSGYATAEGPNGPVLIGARVGTEVVDRRGVGELRVGVQAKDLPSGLLLCPAELSDEAREEWEKGGRPVSILCGSAFVEALTSSGVGVRWLSAPVPYLDDGLLTAINR